MRKRKATGVAATLDPDLMMIAGSTFHTGSQTILDGTRARASEHIVQTRPGAWSPEGATSAEADEFHRQLREEATASRDPGAVPPPADERWQRVKSTTWVEYIQPLWVSDQGIPVGPVRRELLNEGQCVPPNHGAVSKYGKEVFEPVEPDEAA